MASCRTVIVVLNGAAGTGKSALAAKLANAYGWPVLAKDYFKETLLEMLGSGDRAWSRRLSDASFDLLFGAAGQWCGRTPVVVLEGNFRPDTHGERLEKLRQAAGAEVMQVLLHAEHATLRARFAARAGAGQRHAGHLDMELLTEIDSDPDYFTLRPLPTTGRLITEDTTQIDDLLLERLAARIHAATHQFGAACGSVNGLEWPPGPPGAHG